MFFKNSGVSCDLFYDFQRFGTEGTKSTKKILPRGDDKHVIDPRLLFVALLQCDKRVATLKKPKKHRLLSCICGSNVVRVAFAWSQDCNPTTGYDSMQTFAAPLTCRFETPVQKALKFTTKELSPRQLVLILFRTFIFWAITGYVLQSRLDGICYLYLRFFALRV